MKKTVSVILVLLMVLSAVPLVSAEEIKTEQSSYMTYGDYQYDITSDGSAVITKYTGKSPTVKLPGDFYGHLVKYIGDSAFAGCTTIESVSFDNCLIQQIGSSAFAGCSALKAIILPENLTEICYGAFEDCAELETVKVGNELLYIRDNVFSGCPKLTVFGKAGSLAESYAEQNNIKFVVFLKGDINGDTTVNMRDVINMLQGFCGLIELSQNQLLLCDVNEDGQVNLRDCSALQKQISA